MTRSELAALLRSFIAAGEPNRVDRATGLVARVRSLHSVRSRKAQAFLGVHAQVRASAVNGWYSVAFHPIGHKIVATCSCRDAAGRTQACKHALAVAMVALAKCQDNAC